MTRLSRLATTTMKASSQVVLIADSLCYDDPKVKVDSVKEYVLLLYTYYIHIYILPYKVEYFSILVDFDYFSLI